MGRGNIFSFLGRFILRFDFFGLYLQSRNESKRFPLRRFAEIAQLVEHNLAKVGVAGSSPVFRSNNPLSCKVVRVAELVDALL